MPTQVSQTTFPLAAVEPRLRYLLPADLYATAWVDPSPSNLAKVHEHLRTLQRILHDYVPRQLVENPPTPGQVRYEWQEGTLMFTDLAGFTHLVEAHASLGDTGAETLLGILNSYFAQMLEVVSKSGGILLEFTGDALLVLFQYKTNRSDTAQAIRAGLRMQRMMEKFASIETPQGNLPLNMRVGIHTGRFLIADIGTPRRMCHVLLGNAVQRTKRTEAAGKEGRVCLSDTVADLVREQFRLEPGQPGYFFVTDDLTAAQLGEYEITISAVRRPPSLVLMDRSVEALVSAITKLTEAVEPLAGFLPTQILELVVESAARRRIPPDFLKPTIVCVNIMGLPEAMDQAQPGEEAELVDGFSRLFAQINAAVEARGGTLKNVTYHLAGSDTMIIFGAPAAHTDDPMRAAAAALAIREIIINLPPPEVNGSPVLLNCQIGITFGAAFTAEIGDPRGRREYNIHGDTVNTAARLMGRAVGNRILMTKEVYEAISTKFDCQSLGAMPLKGKTAPVPIYALRGRKEK